MKTSNLYDHKNMIIWIGIIFFLLGICSYYLFDKFSKEDISGTNTIFTNPALNYTELMDSIMSSKTLDLGNQINDYISYKKSLGDITHLSVYYRNLNNGGWFGINEKEQFSPASLMKLPILLAYLKQSEITPGLLDQKILYKKSTTTETYRQNISPEEQLKDGQEYTLREIIQYMIIYSDNNASSFLEGKLPIDDFKKVFTDIGILFPEVINGSFDNNIRVIDYSSFFRVLFNSSYLNRKDSEKALSLLSKIKFKDGLVAGVPENILISHKFGERGIIGSNGIEEKQLHDCGIVYYPNHPYLLCVMTRGYDRTKLESIISDISQLVYTETKKQYGDDPLDISTNGTNTNIDASGLQSN